MEALLIEVMKPMVEIMVSRVKEEIRFFKGFKHELKKLEKKIKIIARTVDMSTVDMLTGKDGEEVEEWLRKAVGIVYDAADLLDELAYEKHRADVRKRREKKASTMRKIRVVIFAPLRRAYVRSRMGSRIRSITGDFQDALKEAQEMVQLKDFVKSARASSPLKPPAAIHNEPLQEVRRNVDESYFVGRDIDFSSVVKMLCNPHNLTPNRRISVVAIVGLGGMGKTSLAKQVYDNFGTVVTHFSERIWIPILEEFGIEEILNKMVEHLGMGNKINYSAEIAVEELKKKLGGKRYLLVLDDVWNNFLQRWNSLRSRLESIGGSMESKVLVTTRDKNVAQTMCGSSYHELKGLSEDHSWHLFEPIAFEGCSEGDALALKASGWEIMNKCKGVPLAISSIAGLCKKEEVLLEGRLILLSGKTLN